MLPYTLFHSTVSPTEYPTLSPIENIYVSADEHVDKPTKKPTKKPVSSSEDAHDADHEIVIHSSEDAH